MYYKTMANMAFSQLVLAEIERRGMTVAEAARFIGVPYDAVRDLKRKPDHVPKFARAQKMLEKLGLAEDPSEFFSTERPSADISAITPKEMMRALRRNEVSVQIVNGNIEVRARISPAQAQQLVKMIEGAADALADIG